MMIGVLVNQRIRRQVWDQVRVQVWLPVLSQVTSQARALRARAGRRE